MPASHPDRRRRSLQPPAVSPLEAHLGYWLRFVSNHVSHAFRRKVENQRVTVAEWVVLRELYRLGPASPSLLVNGLGLSRGAVSRLLDRVEAKQLITRKSSSDDRRSHIVALTPAGASLVPTLGALADQNDEQFFGCLPAADREALGRILKHLARIHGLKNIPVD